MLDRIVDGSTIVKLIDKSYGAAATGRLTSN
jgi:hypothetical protein